MPCRVGPAAVLQALFASALIIVVAGAATAQQARDCSGTLCDLYYGGNVPDTPDTSGKNTAPTPLTVPGGGLLRRMFGGDSTSQTGTGPAAPEKRPLVGVGGGGLASMARGEPAQRCSGTLCDMFYGGPAPEAPAVPNPAEPTAPQQATAEAVRDALPPQRPAAADPEIPVYRAPSRCAAAGRDPWSCYR